MHHLPNLITGLRFALIPVLVALVLDGRHGAAFALFLVSAASDLADGLIARRWNARTRFGAVADPLADKLTMLAVALTLASQTLLPLWLAAAIVTRDLVIVGGVLAFQRRFGRVEMAPSRLSKLNTVLEFGVLAALLADAAGRVDTSAAQPTLFVLLTTTIVASGAHYVWVGARRVADARRGRAVADPR